MKTAESFVDQYRSKDKAIKRSLSLPESLADWVDRVAIEEGSNFSEVVQAALSKAKSERSVELCLLAEGGEPEEKQETPA